MPIICNFILNREKPIYYAGEQIKGSVVLTTTKKMLVDATQLSFLGMSEVKWSENLPTHYQQHNDSTEVIRQTYFGTHGHFRDTKLNEENVMLYPEQTFTRDFCFEVPQKLPATFKNFHGEVKYMLKFVLKRHKKMFDKTFKQPLVIKACLDLSKRPVLNEAFFIRTLRKPHISHDIAFSIARTGFVPGQLLRYNLHVNKSGKCVKILVQLCQRLVFHSKLPVHKSKETKRIISCNKIRLRQWELAKLRNLSIPLAVPITTINQEVLVQNSYYVEVIAKGKANQILEKLLIPVVIGTVPIFTVDDNLEEEEEQCRTNFCYDNLASTVVQHKGAHDAKQQLPSSEENNGIFEIISTQPVEYCDRMALLALKEGFRNLA